jgi:hypothetical protein
VTTMQIYKGSIAFIIMQVIMVAVIIINPSIVTGSLGKAVVVDEQSVSDMLNNMRELDGDTDGDEDEPAEGEEAEADADEEVDPAKALQDAMKKAE